MDALHFGVDVCIGGVICVQANIKNDFLRGAQNMSTSNLYEKVNEWMKERMKNRK